MKNVDEHNDLILACLRGAEMVAVPVSLLEAMVDPSNPNRYEANDNADPVAPATQAGGAQDVATRPALTLIRRDV